MTISTLAQRVGAFFARELAVARQTIAGLPRLLPWTIDRAKERSTWIGLSAVAAAVGKTSLADHLTQSADAIVFALAIGGSALAAANTSKKAQN